MNNTWLVLNTLPLSATNSSLTPIRNRTLPANHHSTFVPFSAFTILHNNLPEAHYLLSQPNLSSCKFVCQSTEGSCATSLTRHWAFAALFRVHTPFPQALPIILPIFPTNPDKNRSPITNAPPPSAASGIPLADLFSLALESQSRPPNIRYS